MAIPAYIPQQRGMKASMDSKSAGPLIVVLSLMMLASAALGWQLAERMVDLVQPPDPHPPVLLVRK